MVLLRLRGRSDCKLTGYLLNSAITSLWCLQAAVGAHGKEDVVMWVRYARYLQKLGKGYGTIAWRASKELNSPDEFIALMSSNSGRNSNADIH